MSEDEADTKEGNEDASKEKKKGFNIRVAFVRLVFVSITGILVYALVDPLKSVTKNFIWKESLELSETTKAIVGVPQSYQFALVNKSSVAGISGGTVDFSHEGNGIAIVGKSKFIFGPSENSILVPTEERLSMVVHSAGVHELKALIETQRGSKFEGLVSVNAQPRRLITANDYTGLWHVVLNGNEGSMNLVQKSSSDRHFAGQIELHSGEVLEILEGPSKWDGRTLVVWAVDKNGTEYNIQSRKCRVEIDGTFWVFAHGDYKVTLPDGQVEAIEYEEPRYVEECPGEDKISPRPKSGSFFARAESR